MTELLRVSPPALVRKLGRKRHWASTERAEEILKVWLMTEFEGGRHADRLAQVAKLEDEFGEPT